ncbi:MAG: T9SS type A sorting domain-containing protein, partial [Ferruginibacter sp.]
NNVGRSLNGCSGSSGSAIPCSDYTYTSKESGLQPEFRYSILKTIGDANGGNCIKGDWRGSDHTGDGGYFMAVNGAPTSSSSPIFYQIKSIPVCIGTRYEFSAWVINLLPGTSSAANPGSEPNISFKVNGTVIANSGAIAYNNNPVWVKVGGSFVATTSTVDLQVVNATAVALGNDLGLDDISINVCQSNIAVNGPASNCEGTTVNLSATVTDATQTNTWYKWQLSTNGGSSFTDLTTAAQGTYTGSTMTVPYAVGVVNALMVGHKYRLVIAAAASGLSSPDCNNFNEFTLLVQSCGPLPVKLAAFNGRYSNNAAKLDWKTSMELNSDHFQLFRSFDGVDFYPIARIQSAGNTSTVKDYSYTDQLGAAQSPFVYYRLKQFDRDGKFTFSSIVRLATARTSGMQVYPNPFRDNISVTVDAAQQGKATIQIFNAMAQNMFTQTVMLNKGSNTIVLNNLPDFNKGTYVISLQNESIQYTSKLIKK